MKKSVLALTVSLSMSSFSYAGNLIVPDIISPSKTTLIIPDIIKSTNMHQEDNINTLYQAPFVRTGPTIQIAILLDTSQSMDGLIEQAKQKIWKIINEVSKANKDNKEARLQVALYEYGKSTLSESSGFSRMLTPLTGDLDRISEELFSLKTRGGNEYAGHVILKSLNQLQWSTHPEDLKMIVIAGNESFSQGKIDPQTAIAAASLESVIVNTIFCGNYDTGQNLGWEVGAKKGNGKYLNIDQNKSIRQVITPYDQSIIQYGNDLSKTYIGFGQEGKALKSRQMKQDKNAESVSLMMSADRAISKASSLYDTSSWDTVSKYAKSANKDSFIKEIKNNEESFKNLSEDEVKLKIEENNKKRTELTSLIKDLEKKRTKFIEENKDEDSDLDLSTVLMKTIKTQGGHKGFVFK